MSPSMSDLPDNLATSPTMSGFATIKDGQHQIITIDYKHDTQRERSAAALRDFEAMCTPVIWDRLMNPTILESLNAPTGDLVSAVAVVASMTQSLGLGILAFLEQYVPAHWTPQAYEANFFNNREVATRILHAQAIRQRIRTAKMLDMLMAEIYPSEAPDQKAN